MPREPELTEGAAKANSQLHSSRLDSCSNAETIFIPVVVLCETKGPDFATTWPVILDSTRLYSTRSVCELSQGIIKAGHCCKQTLYRTSLL